MTELFSKEVGMYDTGKAFYRHYEYIQRENSLYSRWFQKRGLSYPQFLILDAVLRSPEGSGTHGAGRGMFHAQADRHGPPRSA